MTHVVIVNHEEQYAVWPRRAELPAGWRATDWTGDERACLERVAEGWTDLRPASVREAVAEDAARPAVQLLTAGPVQLREVLPAEAEQLRDGGTAGLDWLGGTPGDGTRVAAKMLAGAAAAGLLRPGWGMYLLVRSEDAVVVGGMGFHGAPDGGQVEIGFDLVEPARGHGYATLALGELACWALAQDGVDRVIATTTPDNHASQRVMERAAFARMPDADGLFVYQLTH
ncbi:GNAT family N-acetyltransferase [Kitasatospora sp. NPDC094028]